MGLMRNFSRFVRSSDHHLFQGERWRSKVADISEMSKAYSFVAGLLGLPITHPSVASVVNVLGQAVEGGHGLWAVADHAALYGSGRAIRAFAQPTIRDRKKETNT